MEEENIGLLDSINVRGFVLKVVPPLVFFVFLMVSNLIVLLSLSSGFASFDIRTFVGLILFLLLRSLLRCRACSIGTLVLKPAFQHLLEARFERLLDLPLRRALDQDWVCEAFKQVHSVAVGLHIVAIFAAQHVQLDTVAPQVLNQERVTVVECHLQPKAAYELQVFGQPEQEPVVLVLEILALAHIFVDDTQEGQRVFGRDDVLRDAVGVDALRLELLEVALADLALLGWQEFVEQAEVGTVVDREAGLGLA